MTLPIPDSPQHCPTWSGRSPHDGTATSPHRTVCRLYILYN